MIKWRFKKIKFNVKLDNHKRRNLNYLSLRSSNALQWVKRLFEWWNILKSIKLHKFSKIIGQIDSKRGNMLKYLTRTDYHRCKLICVDYGISGAIQKNVFHRNDFQPFIYPLKKIVILIIGEKLFEYLN